MVRKLAMPALAVLGVTLVAFLLEQTLRLINQLEANGAHHGRHVAAGKALEQHAAIGRFRYSQSPLDALTMCRTCATPATGASRLDAL